MLPSAAKLAIQIAIATNAVSAVCFPVNDSEYQIKVRGGLCAMTTMAEGVNGQQVVFNQEDARSLLVWPKDLMIGKFEYVPQDGDKWEITLPNGTKINAVCAAFPPEIHWRWTDQFETARRIHLKVMFNEHH
jgi:hypothetical protein